jgi:hypothetical protein
MKVSSRVKHISRFLDFQYLLKIMLDFIRFFQYFLKIQGADTNKAPEFTLGDST